MTTRTCTYCTILTGLIGSVVISLALIKAPRSRDEHPAAATSAATVVPTTEPRRSSSAAAPALSITAGVPTTLAPSNQTLSRTARPRRAVVRERGLSIQRDAHAGPAVQKTPATVVTATVDQPPPKLANSRDIAKLDAGLQEALMQGASSPQRVIIQYGPEGLDAEKLRALGVTVLHANPGARTLVAEGDPTQIARIASLGEALRISTDAVVVSQQSSTFTDGVTLRNTLGLLPGGGMISGGSSYAGDKIVVAVLDSGIQPSKDLERNRILAFYDVTRTGAVATATPFDNYGHGTHVAGLIGGSGDLSSDRFEGAASKARFVAYKVLDGKGAGYTSHVIAAIDHAIANRLRFNIRVMNLSLGHPVMEPAATDPLVQAVERAVRAGIIVVVSAGNAGINPATGYAGYGGITSPGNAPSAITVGAIDINRTEGRGDDLVQTYSSRGPTWYDAFSKPDLVAPGHRLVGSAAKSALLYTAYPELRVAAAGEDGSPSYLRLSGTSMAAAVTTGVIAAGLEAFYDEYPTRVLSPNTAKAILQFTALQVPGADVLTQGAGAINPVGAMRFMDAMNPTRAGWTPAALTPFDTIGGRRMLWSQQIIWGDHIIAADQIRWGNQNIWGTEIIWGNNDEIIWGNTDEIIWGTNDEIIWRSTVWGNQSVWGQNIVWGDRSIGVRTPEGIIYGYNIEWGNVVPNQVVWTPPSAAAASSTTIVDLSLRD